MLLKFSFSQSRSHSLANVEEKKKEKEILVAIWMLLTWACYRTVRIFFFFFILIAVRHENLYSNLVIARFELSLQSLSNINEIFH